MKTSDIFILLIIASIVGAALFYIIKSKRNGKKCIGCSESEKCGGCCGCSADDYKSKE